MYNLYLIYFISYCISSMDFDHCLTIKSDWIITSKSNTAKTNDCERFAMSFQVLRYAFLFQVDLEDTVDIAIITWKMELIVNPNSMFIIEWKIIQYKISIYRVSKDWYAWTSNRYHRSYIEWIWFVFLKHYR